MTLIKTSLLNGVAVFVRILSLLGINKILALYVGPLGFAALGQFQNAITMISTFASGAINTGVTKYTAEFQDNEQGLHALWKTAGTIAFWGSLLTSCLIAFYSKVLALWFLKDESYAGVFLYFAGSLLFFVFNTLLLAILNGKKEIGRYVAANIIGSVFSLLLIAFLVLKNGLYGALIALAVFQSVSFFATLLICRRTQWFKLSYLFGHFDKAIAKDLAKYTLMALSTALCVPISHILIRNYLGDTLGWESAGYWEAMWRLSAAYLMLVTSTLSVYYLPRISELKTGSALKLEVLQGYKLILPLAAICAICFYLLRDFIIHLLFSEEFKPMRVLFLGQIIGDILKIGSWILAFIMLGKAMTKYFVLTEILFSASFYCMVVLLTTHWGLQGASWAYAINYLLYWLTMYFLVFRRLGQIETIRYAPSH